MRGPSLRTKAPEPDCIACIHSFAEKKGCPSRKDIRLAPHRHWRSSHEAGAAGASRGPATKSRPNVGTPDAAAPDEPPQVDPAVPAAIRRIPGSTGPRNSPGRSWRADGAALTRHVRHARAGSVTNLSFPFLGGGARMSPSVNATRRRPAPSAAEECPPPEVRARSSPPRACRMNQSPNNPRGTPRGKKNEALVQRGLLPPKGGPPASPFFLPTTGSGGGIAESDSLRWTRTQAGGGP